MKKSFCLFLIVGALTTSSAFAQEKSVWERARDGVKQGADTTVKVVKKGADATARGFKQAGEWIEKKTGSHPSQNAPETPPSGG